MKYVHSKQEFNPGSHFAVLVFSYVHIPGDERSRTNPGHGYPAEDRPVVQYISFDSRDEMERWVQREESRRNVRAGANYQVIEVKPLAVSVKAVVAVG